MSVVLTVSIDPGLLSRAEARAARLGLDRAGYVRGLIQQDLERPDANVRSRFASEDLVGAFRLGGAAATNQRVREQVLQRSRARLASASTTPATIPLTCSTAAPAFVHGIRSSEALAV